MNIETTKGEDIQGIALLSEVLEEAYEAGHWAYDVPSAEKLWEKLMAILKVDT